LYLIGAEDADTSAAERIQLINVGFEAFSIVASTFGPAWAEELRAVAVSLYGGKKVYPGGTLMLTRNSIDFLKDETSTIDVVSPTLQSLKALLDVKSMSNTDDKYDRVAHAILSSCLGSIDQMRFDEGTPWRDHRLTVLAGGVKVLSHHEKSRVICLLRFSY
jgi:HEAT repeat-containing protein 5